MVIFRLGEQKLAALDCGEIVVIHRLERQTEKALLLSVAHRSATGERKASYWVPKSQVKLDNCKPFGEVKLEAFGKIEIPDWLWDKRKPA